MEIVFNSTPVEKRLGDALLTPSPKDLSDAREEPAVLSEGEVLRILEEQPSLDDLTRCLSWLCRSYTTVGHFNITLPGPRAASIVNALVSNVGHSFWHIIRSNPRYSNQVKNLITCLRSVTGLGALILKLRALITAEKQSNPGSKTKKTNVTNKPTLKATRELLVCVLFGKDTVSNILDTVLVVKDRTQQQSLWSQAVALLAGGRILSILAQVDLLVRDPEPDRHRTSLGDGAAYAAWLGENIRNVIVTDASHGSVQSKAKAALFGKAISLGYTQQLVETCFAATFTGDELRAETDFSFLKTLKIHEQRQILYTALQFMSTSKYREARDAFVPGLAALLKKWCSAELGEAQPLVQWLAGIDRGRTTADTTVRRAVVAVLAESNETLGDVCNQLLRVFGDPVYIQNASVAQQEVQAQNLLLSIGTISQNDAATLEQLLKSSVYINAVSNRLSSSASRPRLLGMFVAVAISGLAEDEKNQLKFEEVSAQRNEMETYERLVKFSDKIGRISDLHPRDFTTSLIDTRNSSMTGQLGVSSIKTTRKHVQIRDSESSESEEEDDPTLVNRKKPTPPVYIRDLLQGLNNPEEQEQYKICIIHAAKLIQRKVDFGSEVSDHLEELATALAGARDTFEKKELAKAQLQAMIAVIMASSSTMGYWFSISVFSGDYSMSQRTSMLTALVFAARELAGYKNEDSSALSAKQTDPMALEGKFPSQRLPAGLRAFSEYPVTGPDPVNILASKMEQSLIQPMAASAADQVAGPDALKVRTFSSRLKAGRQRQSTITNKLSMIVADSMFFPLVDRFQLEMDMRGSSSPFASPFLLAHFVKTLGLLVAASGPNTPSLPSLTSELLALCLSSRLRQSAIEHLPVLESLLFCLLVLLEVNSSAAKRLVADRGSELLEVKAWVEIVLERISTGDKETERVKTLGAGVLVHCTEFINQYQEQMLGRAAEFL